MFKYLWRNYWMWGIVVIIMLLCSKFMFSQQNIYDSLAHKFYDLNEDSTLTYQMMKNDLDSLIVSSRKNYYRHKMQEINLITNFLEDLIDLNGKGMMGIANLFILDFETIQTAFLSSK